MQDQGNEDQLNIGNCEYEDKWVSHIRMKISVTIDISILGF